jgi:hypothetical protein
MVSRVWVLALVGRKNADGLKSRRATGPKPSAGKSGQWAIEMAALFTELKLINVSEDVSDDVGA